LFSTDFDPHDIIIKKFYIISISRVISPIGAISCIIYADHPSYSRLDIKNHVMHHLMVP